jgi:hypothetical protein
MPGLFMISGPGSGLVLREYLLRLHQKKIKKERKERKALEVTPELPLLVAATLRRGTDTS